MGSFRIVTSHRGVAMHGKIGHVVLTLFMPATLTDLAGPETVYVWAGCETGCLMRSRMKPKAPAASWLSK